MNPPAAKPSISTPPFAAPSRFDELYMCSPEYFDVQYAINPWMTQGLGRVDTELAKQQWENLYKGLSKFTKIRVLDGLENFLDMVFVANAGLAIANKCVVSNFRFAERRGETAHWLAMFKAMAYDTLLPAGEEFFEGEGDALYDRNHSCIWAGYGMRSSKEAYATVESFFDIECVLLELTNPHFYHLDTCLSVLPNGLLLYVPEAFSDHSLAEINRRVARSLQIRVSEKEAKVFCCNTVSVHDVLFCNAMSQNLVETLASHSMRVIVTDMSEFIKSGGSAKCCVMCHYNK